MLQCSLARKKHLSNTVFFDMDKTRDLRREKLVGNLQQHAGTITGFFFGTTRATMIKIDKNLKCIFDKLVTGATL